MNETSKPKIGERCRIHESVVIGKSCVIGNDVILKPGVILAEGTIIGNSVFMGPGTITIREQREGARGPIIMQGAQVMANCLIEANIMSELVVIGACSYVRNEITSPGLYYGVPATLKREFKPCLQNILCSSVA